MQGIKDRGRVAEGAAGGAQWGESAAGGGGAPLPVPVGARQRGQGGDPSPCKRPPLRPPAAHGDMLPEASTQGRARSERPTERTKPVPVGARQRGRRGAMEGANDAARPQRAQRGGHIAMLARSGAPPIFYPLHGVPSLPCQCLSGQYFAPYL